MQFLQLLESPALREAPVWGRGTSEVCRVLAHGGEGGARGGQV